MQQASRLPGLGLPTMFASAVVKGLVFTVQHLQNGKGSYLKGFVQHLAGKKYADLLADKVLDMIEHPAWPIFALKMVDTMIDSFSPAKQDEKIPDEVIKSNLQVI